jgi:hypothetical protein
MRDDYDPTEIECGRCGTRFSFELLRCPNCGARVYEIEIDDDSKRKSNSEIPLGTATRLVGKELLSKGLIIVWGLVSIVIAILVYIGLRPVFNGAEKMVTLIMIYLCVAGGALIGSFIAGRFSLQRTKWDGLVVGLLSLGGVLALLAYEFTDIREALRSWITPFGFGLVVGAGWFGVNISNHLTNQTRLEELSKKPVQVTDSDEYGLYYELLMKVNFETEVAERLIEFESKRNPGARRVDLIESAIQRWVKDNRV